MKRWIAGLAIGLTSVLSACGGDQGASSAREGRMRGDRGDGAALPVKTESVARGEITSYIETHARLEAERWVEVVSRAEGIAEKLVADEGDAVRAGQILVQLEKGELSLQLEQARVARELAQTTFERAQALQKRDLVSIEALQSAQHELESSGVALNQAELRLTYAELRAPIDGVVMQRNVELGDLVRVNEIAFVVADLEPLQARIHVPEKRMTQVHPGQEARITVDSAPGRVFPAKVRMINPGVDPSTGTVKVTLDIPPTDGLLKPGMFASVRIVTDRREGTLIVPKKALVLETDEDDVFAVRDGRAVRVRIEIGYTDGDRIEVVSGLTSEDRVITVGHEGLKDGAAVRVVGDGGGAVATNEPPARRPGGDRGEARPEGERQGSGASP